jgi:Ca2+-binding RTX toxin-like protein
MHGRPNRLALAVLTAVLIPAAPAGADQTLGLGQPSQTDGVVTSFAVSGAAGQAVRLRSLQGAATTATTEPVTVPVGGGAIEARLPIGAGGTLALLGASGSPTVSARVEPDADGDAYGDTTQDACPGNAADHEAPCDGTTTFGSALTLAPGSGLSGSGGRLQALQRSAVGTIPTLAEAGVLVRWRLRAQPGKGDTVLQLLRPLNNATQFVVVAESQPVHVTDTGVITVAASVPVQPGDRLAVRTTTNGTNNDLGAVAAVAGDELSTGQPPVEKGGTWTPLGMPSTGRLLVQADVEPDADGNGLGDVTQDSADLQLTGAPASSTAHIYALRNLGPGTAYDVVVTMTGGAPTTVGLFSNVTCGPGNTCRIARFPARGYVLLAPTFATPSFPAGAGPFTVPVNSSATVSATTADPDLANNGPVAISTSYTVGGTPLTPKPPGPCFNVIRGTRDDDVLRGTVFADRLVGGDGDDLLKGGAADDCLEGGAGADVLDGGEGNDRISGASGRDRLIGGKGDDKLTGGNGNDRLSGGSGNDVLSPGAGHDAIDGGAGDDTINAVDGVRETVVCGAGQDTVRADRRDRLRGCEKVTRKK